MPTVKNEGGDELGPGSNSRPRWVVLVGLIKGAQVPVFLVLVLNLDQEGKQGLHVCMSMSVCVWYVQRGCTGHADQVDF